MHKKNINTKSILKGTVFSLMLTIILVIIIAIISYFFNISDKLLSALLFLTSIISVFFGAIFVSKTTGQKGLVHGLFLALGYFLVLFCASAITKKQFDISMGLFTMFLADIASGLLGGILGVN